MANPVTIADLEARWRPFTADETAPALARLNDAWAILQANSPGFETGVDPDAIRFVVCSMVLRVLKNPDGHRQESSTIDDSTESFTIDSAISSGFMYVTPDELRLIGAGRKRAGSFTMSTYELPAYYASSS